MNNLPQPYKVYVESVVNATIDAVTAGHQATISVLLGNDDNLPMMLSLMARSETEKKAKQLTAKMVSKVWNCNWAIIVGEAYTLDVKSKDEVERIIAEHGSVADAPQAVESVFFMLQTKSGIWAAICPIKRLANEKRAFDAPVFNKIEKSIGGLDGFIDNPFIDQSSVH